MIGAMSTPTGGVPLEIAPQTAAQLKADNQKVVFIDVREPNEFAICKIDGAELIPMRQIPGELQDLEAKAEHHLLVVFCHHGMRSMNVVNWLRQQGVEACTNMAGGIDAWSLTVDPTVPRY
jgi:rhodanese-related sulfurtransferase